jgi:deoxyribodipyrimidine photolyase-related protein
MSKTSIHIIFPNQLFKNSEILDKVEDIILIEEYLYFNQYKFHKQKIAFHRATMKAYENHLTKKEKNVTYISAKNQLSDVRKLLRKLNEDGISEIHIIDPTDNWLEKHINESKGGIKINWYDNPLFINTKKELSTFFKPTKKEVFSNFFL